MFGDNKENFCSNLSQHRIDELSYIKNLPKIKKEISEKALSKLQSMTPPSKKGTRTPKNSNITGKSPSSRIKTVFAVTPKKKEERKTLTGKKIK